MDTQGFRIRHINEVGIVGESNIFRNPRKKVPRFRVELEEFVDMAFALLQWSVWISSRTRLVFYRRERCDAEFVEIFMYVLLKCDGVAIIIHVFGVEVTEFRNDEVNSFSSVGSLPSVQHTNPLSREADLGHLSEKVIIRDLITSLIQEIDAIIDESSRCLIVLHYFDNNFAHNRGVVSTLFREDQKILRIFRGI
jgi:hypothetical protein